LDDHFDEVLHQFPHLILQNEPIIVLIKNPPEGKNNP
jgi:hypothetical protein